jgi:hypothetical protein
MALPLNALPEGGFGMEASKLQNALTKQNLENMYYAPNIQSEIGYRNALATGQNIENQYAPDKLRIANAISEIQRQYEARNQQANINSLNANTNNTNTLTPLVAAHQKLENDWYAREKQADINYKNMGGGRSSVAQKDLSAFTNQLQNDNPIQPNEDADSYNQRINDMIDAYSNGLDSLPNGEKLPPLSWRAEQLQNNVMNRNVPVAVRNQLSNYNLLVNGLKSFDINAVKNFAGPEGRAKLIYAKAKMAINPDDPSIDPMARRYLSAMNESIINMDKMRKAFGTSVVPDYVYKTVGRLTNPNDSIWLDPKQVVQNYETVVKSMENDRNQLQNAYRHGLNAKSPSGANPEPLVRVSSPDGKDIQEGTEAQVSAFLKDHKDWKRVQ